MIQLIKNFKYDNSYDYVKMFSTKEEQKNYFNSLSKIVIDEHNYVKEHESFRIKIPYDELVEEGINYVIFDNGYREVFAFITSKEYLNKEVTRINYEIDVIQTYMFNFTLDNSFVERKVCAISEITDFDEGLEIGEHKVISNQIAITKDSHWFAMFNGIKEQEIVFNNNGQVADVINLPFYTSKPLTLIDNIQYPLYFMPLQETYPTPTRKVIDTTSSSVVQSARKLLGLPYVWGGNYPPLGNDRGTDCSGLCMWAYNDCGLLPNVGLSGRWTTYTMIEHATAITYSMAMPGDVVFSNFSSPGVPEHVAIISDILPTTGQLKIIEAPSEGIPVREILITYDSTNYDIRRLI